MGNLILNDFWSQIHIKKGHIFQEKGGLHANASGSLITWLQKVLTKIWQILNEY